MKHVFLILIMWLATLGVDAQQLQKAVINDPDGYTNVRKGQGAGTAIVGRINDGEVFYVQKLSNNSWWPVYLQKNGTRLGYMHKSRVSILGKEASSASSSTKGFVQGTHTKDVERFYYSYPISFTFKNGKVTYNESNGELVIVGKYSQIYPGVLRVTFNDVVKGSLVEYGLYSHKISYNIAWGEEKEDGRRYIEIQDWDGNGSLFGWMGRIYLTGPNAYNKAKKAAYDEQQRREREENARREAKRKEREETGGPAPRVLVANGVQYELVFVEGGTFTMGGTDEQGYYASKNESPTHRVTVSDFFIGKTEVTQALWTAVMDSNPSEFKGDNLPVENVSWNDCIDFISKLNSITGLTFRLPTEAEWEYAARGGDLSQGYVFSGGFVCGFVAWYVGNSRSSNPVAKKSPNELGIYDMSGNIREWCSDWYGDYSSNAQNNPKGPDSGTYRVFRGGDWRNDGNICCTTSRNGNTPDFRSNSVGLRLVLVP